MSDTAVTEPRPTLHLAEGQRKRTRKAQPEYPFRLTFCLAPDQYENLQVVKKAFRASEAHVLRMAFDLLCRSNGFTVTPGDQNGR